MSFEFARSYLQRGWAVFPIVPGGRTPLTEHGFKDASKDPEQVNRWIDSYPDANIGVACGAVSHVIVLDVDRKNGVDGVISAAEFELPETLVVKTPSGGFHLIYELPEGVIIPRKIKVRPGLDILGEGGYFIAAGSQVGGVRYEIVRDRPLARCPNILAELAAAARIGTDGQIQLDDDGVRKKMQAGGRNNYLTSMGGKLRRIGFDHDEMVGALLTINNLRCNPPLPEAEVRRTAQSIARYTIDAKAAEAADQISPLITLSLADLLAAEYPPPEFCLSPILEHPSLCLLYGPTGVSKTFFALAMGLAISSGQRWLKYAPDRQCGVLYVDGELGNRVLKQRIKRLIGGHEFIPSSFHTMSRDDQANGIIPDLNDLNAQARFVAAIPEGIEVVFLDNLSTLTTEQDGKSTNDWGSWDAMQRLLLALRRRGLTVITVHHANKGGTEQSGTARRSHIMDTVISLRRHDAEAGAAPKLTEVEVHTVKGRNLPPGMTEPYIATLAAPYTDAGGDLTWSCGELGARKAVQIRELLELGMPVSQIIIEVGCANSLAYRIQAEMRSAGVLKNTQGKRGRKKPSWSGAIE